MIRRRISMASRRSHARHLELRTRQLIPDTADDDDPVRAPGLTVDADDVTGMKSVETGRTLSRDQQRVTARDVTARVAIGADPDRSTALVHTDDGEAILLKPVGKALRHCETPFQLAADTNATVAECYVWSDQIVNIARPSCRCSMKMSPRYGDLHDEQEGSASGGPRKSRVGGEDHQRRGSRSLASDGPAVRTPQGARSHGGCGRVAASCAGPPGPASPRRRPPGTGRDAHDDSL